MLPAETPAKRSERVRLACRVLTWALWFGILTGYLELFNLGFRKYVLGRIVLLGGHTIWLAPLADAALFLLVGAILVPIAILWPGRGVQRVAIFAFGFTLAASLVLLYREIHNYAAALLSTGAAVLMARCAAPRLDAFDGLVRRTLPWMTAAALGSAVLLPAWWAWSEGRAMAALPSAQSDSPNVLIVVWDTVRSGSLSTYGYGRRTSPNLSRLGEQGVVFERAAVPSSWTLPTHASMFTGLWADRLSTSWKVPLDDTCPTLAEALAANGYATAGFVANQFYCSRVHGLDRGFVRYEDFNELRTEFVLSCQFGRRLTSSPRIRRWLGCTDYFGRKRAERIERALLRWIDRRPNRPFFAFLNLFDAHTPYLPPPPYAGLFRAGKPLADVPHSAELRLAPVVEPERFTPEQHESRQDAYDGAIAYLDACLGRLVDALERRGILDDTIVIVTSDHGEHFGEHGLYDHGNSLYRPLLHVPLVIRYPKSIPSGRRPSGVVSLRDLAATVIDLAGCSRGPALPGSSLRARWTEPEAEGALAPPVYAFLQMQGTNGQSFEAVIAEDLHYIRLGDGRESLFDFRRDVAEAHDLVCCEDMQEALRRLRDLATQHAGERIREAARRPGE